MLFFVVSLKSKSISSLIHLKIKMQRCLCLLIPKGVQLSSFRASVAEESGGASSISLAALIIKCFFRSGFRTDREKKLHL